MYNMSKMERVHHGLAIFLDYDFKNVSAGYDIFYAAGPTPENLPEDIKKALDGLEWDWDEDCESWYIHM